MPYTALWGTRYLGISRPILDFYAAAALGQHFLATVYNAVVSSPNWARTALVITYDEWGGFFDHVVPLPITFGCLLPDHAHSGEDWPDLAARARDLGFATG